MFLIQVGQGGMARELIALFRTVQNLKLVYFLNFPINSFWQQLIIFYSHPSFQNRSNFLIPWCQQHIRTSQAEGLPERQMSNYLFLVKGSAVVSEHQPIKGSEGHAISSVRAAAGWNQVHFPEPVCPPWQHTWHGKSRRLHQASIVANSQLSESYLAHSQGADIQTISNLVFSKVITQQACMAWTPEQGVMTHWTSGTPE